MAQDFSNNPTICVVTTTVPTKDEASALARVLLEEKLVACVNYFQVESQYVWEGEIQTSSEWKMIFKASSKVKDQLQLKIMKLHSYSLPEILFWNIEGGSREYVEWLESAPLIKG